MSATTETDNDKNKGAQKEESEEQKQTDSNPDSVQSQDVNHQNQGGSPREDKSEPPLEEYVQRIKEQDQLIRKLKERIEQLEIENDTLKQAPTDGAHSHEENKGDRLVQQNKGDRPLEGDVGGRLFAERNALYIFELLNMTRQDKECTTFCIEKPDDVKRMTRSAGLYVCYLKHEDTEYPIYVGIGGNVRHRFQDHVSKKDPKGVNKSGFVSMILVEKTFPENLQDINPDPKLYVKILELKNATLLLLKTFLLYNFDFCFNRNYNTNRRTKIEISNQMLSGKSAQWVRLKGLWQQIIKEFTYINSSINDLENYKSEDDDENNI